MAPGWLTVRVMTGEVRWTQVARGNRFERAGMIEYPVM